MDKFISTRLWKIEEIGEHSMILSFIFPLSTRKILLPNPNKDFQKEYGNMSYTKFEAAFGISIAETVHTPETVVVYFKDKVPDWAKVGMEVIY